MIRSELYCIAHSFSIPRFNNPAGFCRPHTNGTRSVVGKCAKEFTCQVPRLGFKDPSATISKMQKAGAIDLSQFPAAKISIAAAFGEQH